MNGWIDGWPDGPMDRRADGQKDRWTDRWKDRTHLNLSISTPASSTDDHLGCFYTLTAMNNTGLNFLGRCPLHILCHTSELILEVTLLDDMAILFVIF